MPVEAKRFDQPDETVAFECGRVHVVTVGSLTIGGGIEFVDRGTREFKGISGERPIYEARRPG